MILSLSYVPNLAKMSLALIGHIIIVFFSFVNRLIIVFFHDLVRKFWANRFGFIFPDIKCKDRASSYYKNNYPPASDIIVNSSVHCGKYVSKYICKDIDFFGRPDVSSFLDPNRCSIDFHNACVKEFRPFAPKHWQSRGFGIKLLDEVNSRLDYYLNGGKYYLLADMKGNHTKSYKIPAYILDKVKYDFDVIKDPTFKKRFFTKVYKGEKITIANPFFRGAFHQDVRKFIRVRRYSTVYINHVLHNTSLFFDKSVKYISDSLKQMSINFAQFLSRPMVKTICRVFDKHSRALSVYYLFLRGRKACRFADFSFPQLQDLLQRIDIVPLYRDILTKSRFIKIINPPEREVIYDDLKSCKLFSIACDIIDEFNAKLNIQRSKDLIHLQEFYRDLKLKRKYIFV